MSKHIQDSDVSWCPRCQANVRSIVNRVNINKNTNFLNVICPNCRVMLHSDVEFDYVDVKEKIKPYK